MPMKRIIYLSLLLMVPFFIHADHGRKRLNGKWISPYFNTQIKVRVKRYEVKVKGLSRRGWISFTPIRRNVFEDCNGNRLRIKNIHEMVYVNRFRNERIRFVKKGHVHHNHHCDSRCSIGHDYFGDFGYDSHHQDTYYDDYYNDRYDDDWRYFDNRDRRPRRGNRDNRDLFNNRLSGQYYVREINEYISVNQTRNGLKAKRGNGKWVHYTQNRNRKNEYVDKKGNRYIVRSENEITWKNRSGTVSLNLKK